VYELRTHGLRKVYRSVLFSRARPVTAVDSVDLSVEAGEIYGFLGPNGAGKTTTIKMILGLVRPSAGSMEFPGGIVRKDGRTRIGAVLEGSRNVYMRLSVIENLAYFAALRGMRARDARTRSAALLERYGLAEKAKATAQTLSRGMQQKLAVAVALVHDPDILLLDEPTLGLDVATARDIQWQLKELAHREGKCILLTTHQMELAEAVCDRVGIINKGKLVAEDTVEGLTGVFRREDYEFEVPVHYREQVERALFGLPFDYRETRRPGRLAIRVRLGPDSNVARLVRLLEGQGVVPERLSEVSPRLEDVFLSYTSGKPSDKAGEAK